WAKSRRFRPWAPPPIVGAGFPCASETQHLPSRCRARTRAVLRLGEAASLRATALLLMPGRTGPREQTRAAPRASKRKPAQGRWAAAGSAPNTDYEREDYR